MGCFSTSDGHFSEVIRRIADMGVVDGTRKNLVKYLTRKIHEVQGQHNGNKPPVVWAYCVHDIV